MRRKWGEEMMLQPLYREDWNASISSNEYEGKGWRYLFSQVRQDGITICMSVTFISWELCDLQRDLPLVVIQASKSKETTRSIFFSFSNISGVNEYSA